MALPLAIAAAVPGLFKLGAGIVQGIRANKLKPEDFQYIPPALRENLASQRNRARSARMPGQSLAESNIRQSTANAMNAAGGGSLADKIAAAQGLVAQEQNALAGVGAQAAQFQVGEERALQGLMQDQARLQAQNQQRFEQTKLGLKDASMRNMFGGLSDVGSSITGGAFDGLFGGRNKAMEPPSTALPNAYLRGFASNYSPTNLPAGTFNRYING
jgi:hypothetical protein